MADPEGWARRGVPAEVIEGDMPVVDAESPLADTPEIDLPWPDTLELPALAPLEPEADIRFAEFPQFAPPVEMGSDERISRELVLEFPSERSLFPIRDEFIARFKTLSTIEQLDDAGNAARLAAQARVDQELLERLLGVYGFYDAVVTRTVAASEGEGAPQVRFAILPGSQFRFGTVDLGQLSATGPDYPGLRSAFGVQPGDPLLADRIVDGQLALDIALGEGGYPFAAIGAPSLTVDHARTEGDLDLPVTPGGKYNFGTVISDRPDFLSGKHLARIARFDRGDLYKRSLETDLRQAILATGLVASIELKPVEVTPPVGDTPGTVDMAVKLTPAKLRTISGRIGYGTGEGAKAEAIWEHRNLFPPEGMLRVRGILGTREQLAGVTFRKNNFGGRDQVLTIDMFGNTVDRDAYEARTVSLVGRFERLSNVLFQKPFSWSIGLELVATQEREADANRVFGPRQTYFVAALPGEALFDTSDDLLNPTKGFRLGLKLSPETSRTNGMQSVYLRGQFDASYYHPVGDRVVMAARARLGSIAGAELAAVAPSRRLYAGGGGSVRGYGYRAIGPFNASGDPAGGRSLTEFSLEARVKTPWLGGALQLVPFVDAGTVGADSVPGFDEIKLGAGLGVRYLTTFGPIRLDVGVPLNPGPRDDPVAVYVGLGQAF